MDREKSKVEELKLSQRNGTVDIAKFIFSVVIILNHSNHLIAGKGFFMQGGYLAVEFFFIVSGYLMAKSVSQKPVFNVNTIGFETKDFVIHKFKGIFPYYLLGFVLAFIAVQYVNDHNVKQIIKSAIKSVLPFFGFDSTLGRSEYKVMALAWYIPAMLLGMLIIYPLLKYRRNVFSYIGAPLTCAFIYGYLLQTYKGAAALDWIGICNTGLLRGIAGISLGCISHEICEKIQAIEWSRQGRIFLTLLEVTGYIFAVVHMQFKPQLGSSDFVIIAILTLSIAISFSCKSFSSEAVGDVSVFWSEYGLALYMGHGAVSLVITNNERLVTFESKFVVYIICSFIVSLLLRWAGNYFKKFLRWLMAELKKNFIVA